MNFNKNKRYNLKNHQLALMPDDTNPLTNRIRDQSNPRQMVIDAGLAAKNPIRTPLIPMIVNVDMILTHNQMN